MFATIKVMQLFDLFTPVLGVLPVDTIKELSATMVVRSWFGNEPVYAPLVERTREIIDASEAEGVQVVITGHSLGGAFAGIVSASTGIPGLSWMSPGQLYSQGRHGITDAQIYRSLTLVQPDRDLVSRVDYQLAFTQKVLCDPGVSHGGCHSIKVTACELYRNCNGSAATNCDSTHSGAVSFRFGEPAPL